MNKILLGFLLLAVSYYQHFLPALNIFTLLIAWFLFMFGIIFIGEGVTLRIKQFSLVRVIFRNRKNLISYLVASTLGAILLEGVAQWLGKLWVFPYANNLAYFLLFIPGFAVYWLVIIESYLAAKLILLHKVKKTRAFRYENKLYLVLGTVGSVFFAASLLGIISEYVKQGSYAFSINTILEYKVNFLFVIFAFIGFWFIMEYLEHNSGKDSLVEDLIHKRFVPLIAVFISSFLVAFLMETANLKVEMWKYTNWPLAHIQILHLPVTMLIAWPLHYIGFLSLFKYITTDDSKEIWSFAKL